MTILPLQPWTEKTDEVFSSSVWVKMVSIRPFLEHHQYGWVWKMSNNIEDPDGKAIFYVSYDVEKQPGPGRRRLFMFTDGHKYAKMLQLGLGSSNKEIRESIGSNGDAFGVHPSQNMILMHDRIKLEIRLYLDSVAAE